MSTNPINVYNTGNAVYCFVNIPILANIITINSVPNGHLSINLF